MSKKSNVKSEDSSVGRRLGHRSYGTNTNDEEEEEKEQPIDLLHVTIGDFGKWQCRVSLLMSLLKLPNAWFQLGIVFLAAPTEFWCKQPPQYKNMTLEQWKIFIKPEKYERHKSPLETGLCNMRDIEGNNPSAIIPCRWGYDYNRSIIHSNIITEWDLVCGKERLVDVAQIILMFGVLIGSIIFGVTADKFGRRPILLASIFMQSTFGALSALSPWYWSFIVSRFFLAMANGGTMIISFVMCMEVVGGVWRTTVPILYQIPFGIGNTLMAGIAYLVRDWRQLQFTLSALSALYITYFFFIPESPRWLMAVGRKKEAAVILQKAADTNGMNKAFVLRKVEEIYRAKNFTTTEEKLGWITLFRATQLRKRTTLLCLNWLICGISFYSFSQYIGQISHNLYFAVAVGGVIAAPGTLLCVFVVQRCGRRMSIACANFFTSFCYLMILTIPRGKYAQDWPIIALAGGGVIGMSVSIPALYLFTGELFPTVLRNAGVGTVVMCSKFGSMLAPLVIALGEVVWFFPLLLLGVLSVLEGVLVFPLPETLNVMLPDTLQDMEVIKLSPVRDKGNYTLAPEVEENNNK